jgi:hypothetical protein
LTQHASHPEPERSPEATEAPPARGGTRLTGGMTTIVTFVVASVAVLILGGALILAVLFWHAAATR